MTRSPQPACDEKPPLVLVEDDATTRRGLVLMLHGEGYDVRAFEEAGLALDEVLAEQVPFLVADYLLADVDGIAMLTALRQRGWAGLAVLITGFGSACLRAEAEIAGFAAVLDKPFRDDDLLRALRQ